MRGANTFKIDDIYNFSINYIAHLSGTVVCGSEAVQIPELLNTFCEFHAATLVFMRNSKIIPKFLQGFFPHGTDKHWAVIKKHLCPIIKKRRETGERKEDFMQFLIDSPGPDNQPMTDEIISTRLGVVMWAALITTSQMLSHALVDLAGRPEIQSVAIAEQEKLLDEKITFDNLNKMTYLDCCIRETLRFSTSGLGSPRKAVVDINFGEYRIPKGTMVAVPPRLVHFDPKNWSDPDTFDPTRFADSKFNNVYSFLPFGVGLHACPGRFFAIFEAKIILAYLLRSKFKLSLPCPETSTKIHDLHLHRLKGVELLISRT